MKNHPQLAVLLTRLATPLTMSIFAASFPVSGTYAAITEEAIDVQNDEIDVTLFRGAANVELEIHAIDLRPERDVPLHVEIYSPDGTIPLIVTPGGNGD